MKNYALTEQESKYFITNFDITEDKIIVYYGDDHTEIKEKTKENFERIISILENQIVHSDRKKQEIHYKTALHIKFNLYLIALSIIVGLTLNQYDLFGTPWLFIPAIPIIISGLRIRKNRQILKDIAKHKTFLENQTEILENIKTHPSVLTNTTEKTQEAISNEQQNPTEFLEDQPINFKNLENIPESDINLILENIESLKTVGYVSPEREDKVIRMRPNKRP